MEAKEKTTVKIVVEGQDLSDLVREILVEKAEGLNYRLMRHALIELKADFMDNFKDNELADIIEEYLVWSFTRSPNNIKARQKLESIVKLIPRDYEISCAVSKLSEEYFYFEQFEMKLK